MARKRQDPKAFRLRFQGTTAKKFAPTLKQANADAKYWLAFGQTKVCIDRKLPHSYQQVKCVLKRKGGMAGAPGWWPFGHKKAPAKRGAMTRTVYMMKTKSGSYVPVDRPPSYMTKASSDAAYISGARKRGRKKRRR